MSKNGTEEIQPKTDEQWAAVRSSAATIAEAANLLMLEGRARDNKDWMMAVRQLIDTAEKAMKAAEARNPAAVFDAGGEMYEACRGCHRRYAPQFDTATEGVKK
jgi:cytochrome c556